MLDKSLSKFYVGNVPHSKKGVDVGKCFIYIFVCGCTRFSMYPDSKVHWANMVPIWDRQVPGGPHVGPMNFAIWVDIFIRWWWIYYLRVKLNAPTMRYLLSWNYRITRYCRPAELPPIWDAGLWCTLVFLWFYFLLKGDILPGPLLWSTDGRTWCPQNAHRWQCVEYLAHALQRNTAA